MESDPLPTHAQCRALCALIGTALVEIRALARAGRAAQIEDLADALHNLPREMYGSGRWSREIARGMLADYHSKHPGGRDYVTAFDDAMAAV